MSLEDKIGQMLMPGISKTFVDEEAAQLITYYRAGGIWLTSRNVLNASQTTDLIAALNDVQKQHGPAVPLFISIDHEGGMVNRFPYGGSVTAFPSHMALGAAGESSLAYQVGLAQAGELRALGFNMNLAPVLDVNNNALNPVIGIRSFGADPISVTNFGVQYVLGQKDGGLIGVVKHFPGHGNVTEDSHSDLPVVSDDLLTLEATGLMPFKSAIDNGAPGVMVGHLMIPSLDPDLPASLSPLIIDGYLRGQLGFEGVVFTDDINMRALTRYRSVGESAVLAVLAGADVLPINTGQPAADTARVRDALLAAVQSGRISQERIDQSVRRILQLKAAYGLLGNPLPLPSVDSAANTALADRIGTQSITLVRDEARLIPLAAGTKVLVITPDDGLRVYYRDRNEKTALGLELAKAGFEVREILYKPKSGDPQDSARSLALQLADQYDVVIMGTWDASIDKMQSSPWQQALVPELLERNSRLIVVALRTPYDLKVFPEVQTYFATYGGVPAQMEALAKVLLGVQAAPGHLPVPPQDVIGP
jgi:beta-N-acetylhexosaminidase